MIDHEWSDHVRCVRCGVVRKLSALRDCPECPGSRHLAAERRGFERGFEEAVRVFWAAVCEDQAQQQIRMAVGHVRSACAAASPGTRQRHQDAAAAHGAEAAKYLDWAREAKL